jgi:membrane associated rhomboid family serine protease
VSPTAPNARPPAPPVTTTLIVLNVLVFLWEYRLPYFQQLSLLHQYALQLVTVQHGMWSQFLSYQFLHGGLLHLLFNLLFLHSIGPLLEQTLGARRYLGLYLVSGAFGGGLHVLVAWLSPGHFATPVVGASAGLCGILAAVCALYAEEKVDVKLFYVIPLRMRAKFLLLAVALVTMGGALFPFGNVAHLAHLGGLVGGLVALNFMDVKPLPPVDDPVVEQPRR